jgi:hypothetical protein
MDDVDPSVPAHLRPLLGAAVERELETTTDRLWPDGDDERAAHRDAVINASRMADNWAAGACPRQQIVRLSEHAAGDQQPADLVGRWPTSIEEADDLLRRVSLTRDLLLLRDALGGRSR